jgi:3-phenylpropionate/cinnamic acid dioxygenase small subunit
MAANSTIAGSPAALQNADLSLAVTAGVYHDIQHFLFREALLMDHRRFDEWIALLAPDVVFRMPARFAREIGLPAPPDVDFLHDDRGALISKIKMLRDRQANEEGQQHLITQTRRFITNVIVCPCGRDEYNVLSYLMLTRSTPGEPASTVFTAERNDRLRGDARRMRIVRREIVMDQRNANVAIDMYL